jgi:hypothetical protein
MPARKRPTRQDNVTARKILLDGLAGDATASLPWPRKSDTSAVTASKASSGERIWLIGTGSARARYERTASGPATCSWRSASPSGRPPSPLPSRDKTSAALQRGSLGRRHRRQDSAALLATGNATANRT